MHDINTDTETTRVQVVDFFQELTNDLWYPEDSDTHPAELETLVDAYLDETGDSVCSGYDEACELACVLWIEAYPYMTETAERMLERVLGRYDEYEEREDEDERQSREDAAREDAWDMRREQAREDAACEVLCFASYRAEGVVVVL